MWYLREDLFHKYKQFVACLDIFYKILSLSHGVNKRLQSSTLNFAKSETLIVSMVSALADLREMPGQKFGRKFFHSVMSI